VLHKRTVGRLGRPVISIVRMVLKSAVMGWRKEHDNHIDSRPRNPIELLDVAPRRTLVDQMVPRSNHHRRVVRACWVHSWTAAPANSASVWCTWWRGAEIRSWRASYRVACISATLNATTQMRDSCRACEYARDRKLISCSLKSLITPKLITVLVHIYRHCRRIVTL
jgi:hypothetical protein